MSGFFSYPLQFEGLTSEKTIIFYGKVQKSWTVPRPMHSEQTANEMYGGCTRGVNPNINRFKLEIEHSHAATVQVFRPLDKKTHHLLYTSDKTWKRAKIRKVFQTLLDKNLDSFFTRFQRSANWHGPCDFSKIFL
jgi:hypothetical protein